MRGFDDHNREREKALLIANTAENPLKTGEAVQDKLAQQLKQVGADNLTMKSDLGFFERLLPAGASEGLVIRGLQVEALAPGHVRFQLLLMRGGKTKTLPEFRGRYEIVLAVTLDGKRWAFAPPGGAQSLQLIQYLRVEGILDLPPKAVAKTASVRVMDLNGARRAGLTVKS